MRQLTQDEIEACANAPQFTEVKPEQVCGPTSDGGLAARIARLNICRYRELRDAYEYQVGLRQRPDAYYN